MRKASNLPESPGQIHGEASLQESDCSDSSLSNKSLRVAENAKKKSEAVAPHQAALKYFSEVKAGTPVKGNDELQRHLETMEKMAQKQGLPPDAISVMLEFAMSLCTTNGLSTRVLRSLIPAQVVPEEAVVRGFSWFCTQKLSSTNQVLFLRWVLTMFDMIDCKDNLRNIYGFVFTFVNHENLCPFICHLLYLLTRKEHVKPYRVRKLVEIQGRTGKQPFLMQLLALYKVLCPELVTLSIPSRMKTGFKNHNSTWKAALATLQRRSSTRETPSMALNIRICQRTRPRKRKFHHLEVPELTPVMDCLGADNRKGVCLQQLGSFSELLDNLSNIELPAQMGSMLCSELALHYLDCVQDESAILRLNFWLGHALCEEFLSGPVDSSAEGMAEASGFLSMLVSTQHFLQEGFSSTEGFLYRFLNVWDGLLHRPQILELLSNITPVPSSDIKALLFEPLRQLYFTSSVFFKCSVIECLTNMLRKWLTWHSVSAQGEGLDISLNNHTSMMLSLSAFLDTVLKLVQFVGDLTSEGLHLERGHTLLLHQALGFYDIVCDMYLRYGLPLFVMMPQGVFFPALLATDPISIDWLGHIMCRYRQNLSSAKKQQTKPIEPPLHVSCVVYKEFNFLLVSMTAHLWNSSSFGPRAGLEVSEAVLQQSKVADYAKSFNLIHHPAYLHYAIDFHRLCWPERINVDLNSIKFGKYWGWYKEFLFNQGFEGLRDFIKVNIGLAPQSSQLSSQPAQLSQPTPAPQPS